MRTFDDYKNTQELYLGDEDKDTLEEMTETQREKILYERYTKIQEINEKKQLETIDRAWIKTTAPPPSVKFEDADFVIKRDILVNNIFRPNFSLFKGCFVRAKVNKDYKISKIIGICEGEPYTMVSKDHSKTILYLNIDACGKIVKKFDINNVSSNGMSEEEYQEFISYYEITSFDDLKAKFRKVTSEMERKPTNDEVSKMIENRLKSNPKKKSNAEKKIEIIIKRDEAVAKKDKQKAFQYQKMLEEIEDQEREDKKKKYNEELEETRKRLHNK